MYEYFGEIHVILGIWGCAAMEKTEINYQLKTLVILPHLDDEFAIVPIIKRFASLKRSSLSFIYCAERNETNLLKRKRRRENIKALVSLGCSEAQVVYLNDYFAVDDLKLFQAASAIYNFLTDFIKRAQIKQIITLNFEGGHPDHDALALVVQKFTEKYESIKPFFVPAYNYRKTMFFPVSVFRPLITQQDFFNKESYSTFVWIDTVKVAFFYSTERRAFIKLIPFIVCKALFSRSIYLASKFDVNTVDWSKSLSLQRYCVDKYDLINEIKGLD